MKVLLMYRDRDFDLEQAMPWNERDLTQDLELETLASAMSGPDDFFFEVTHKAILSSTSNDIDTILYRQAVLRDCLKHPEVIAMIYGLAFETIESAKRRGWGMSSPYPSSMMYSGIDLLELFVVMLTRLRTIAENQSAQFESQGFTRLFKTIETELNSEYLSQVQNHISELKFRKGILLSAELGEANEGTNYVLRENLHSTNWLQRMIGKKPPGYTFYLAERDEAGAQIVSEIRQRGISRVATTLAQSADHVLSFFKALRTELAFYVGCLNLHARLISKEEPVCFPVPRPAGERRLSFSGLYDVCLSLQSDCRVVGNDLIADGNNLTVITGANQGGKSSFLRSVGLAQLMMQCGIFVGARSFVAELCPGIVTHYKREEDATMKSGKFDEELGRMSGIIDHINPNTLLLLNESFAATNVREGSEIARQIVSALLENHIKVFYVTHLYEFARDWFDTKTQGTMFLRAERKPDGTRTFRIIEGEPLETSYGEDLYRRIFKSEESEVTTALK